MTKTCGVGLGIAILASLSRFELCGAQTPRRLFDGATLSGWTRRGGAAFYEVDPIGRIVVGTSVPRSRNSFLCTDRTFVDFDLDYEFRVDSALNSGVQIRSNAVAEAARGRVHGLQIEIDPSERAWTAGVYDEGGRGWLASLETNEPARRAFRAGAWNHVRVVARGPWIRTWLNGVRAADYVDDRVRSGFIGLQVHGTRERRPMHVRWRNLTLVDHDRAARSRDVVAPSREFEVLHREDGDRPGWKVVEPGVIEVVPGTGSLVTPFPHGDCRLHLEFLVNRRDDAPWTNDGNSGVKLQGLYEVQILNSHGRTPTQHDCGAIYDVRAPDAPAAAPPWTWQTLDVAFRAPRWSASGIKTANARMTVLLNGVVVHDDVAVPRATTRGRRETAAGGPLLLQDHGNPVRFRNVILTPLPPGDRTSVRLAAPNLPPVSGPRTRPVLVASGLDAPRRCFADAKGRVLVVAGEQQRLFALDGGRIIPADDAAARFTSKRVRDLPPGAVDTLHRTYRPSADGIVVTLPSGRVVERIHLDVQPIDCAFGGAGRRTLYILTASALWSVRLVARGPLPGDSR